MAAHRPSRPHRYAHAPLALLGATAVLILTACGGESERGPVPPARPAAIEDVLLAHRDDILAVPGVVGVGIGACSGEPCIKVFAERETEQVLADVPDTLDGYTVVIDVSGSVDALDP